MLSPPKKKHCQEKPLITHSGHLTQDFLQAPLDISKFSYENAAASYPDVFERRFRDHPEEGYAYLESIMSQSVEPGPGYAVLARILKSPRHRAVITTNFDNLVADALSAYTDTFPFVCGHESLAGFVRASLRRPLICKIHRDLLLHPKNDPRSTKRLHEAWTAALRMLFEHYTPIFIGYGGNDESLMGMLESLDPGEINGRLIWCHYEAKKSEKTEPSKLIRALVKLHKGVLVRVPDFETLMTMLGQKLGVSVSGILEFEKRKIKERRIRFEHKIADLDTVNYPETVDALADVFGWWGYGIAINKESDPEKKKNFSFRESNVFQKVWNYSAIMPFS